jgi:hypothetical protein
MIREHGYPPDLQEEAVKSVLAQAELLCADWVTSRFEFFRDRQKTKNCDFASPQLRRTPGS